MNTHLLKSSTIALFTALLIAGCAQTSNRKTSIVGTWEFNFTKSVQQTYSQDGGYSIVVSPDGPSDTGTWSVVGDELTMKFPDKGEQTTVKILQLDDSVLVYQATNKLGKAVTTTWRRIK